MDSRNVSNGANRRQNTQKKSQAKKRRKTNKAYKQATVQRNVKSKRKGTRGGNYVMYYILAAAVVVVVLIILANTVLFNCSAVEVEGNSRYTAEQITTQSGIEIGQNLLHIDTDSAEKRIMAAFPYIDEAEVQKSFPTKMRIVVKEAEKWFQVTDNGVTAAVSRLGRIVELGSTEGIPTVQGYDPEELAAGKTLSSSESGKNSIPEQILGAAEECGITDITLIDMTDRFDITVDCGDNITLRIGGVADISVKLAEAAEVMKQESSNVTIDLRTDEKMFVRDKNEQSQAVSASSETPESSTGESAAEGTAEGTSEGTAESAA